MARAALAWTLTDLARAAAVGLATVNRFEMNQTRPNPTTIEAIQRTLEDAGVVFLAEGEMVGGGPGVRLARSE